MHDFPDLCIWLPHRVSYGETDCMGVMYYAEYFHLFERARSEFIRSRGYSYSEVEKKGVILPVREAQCRYRKPARYDDLVWIRAGISELKRASLRFIYEILDEAKIDILATGMTQHAVVNEALKPCAIPEWFRELLQINSQTN